MTYLLHVVAQDVPASDAEVFPFLNRLSAASGDLPPSRQMQRFCDAILKLFPCLTSYDKADQAIEDCPWADGPMIGNFQGGRGSVAVARRHEEVVPRLLRIASDLGLTVVDEQQGAVHRPQTFQVVLEGPADGVDADTAAVRLAELMNVPVAQLAAVLHARRRTVVKKGVPRAQAAKYVAALQEKAGCKASLAAEPRQAAPVAATPVVAAPVPVAPVAPAPVQRATMLDPVDPMEQPRTLQPLILDLNSPPRIPAPLSAKAGTPAPLDMDAAREPQPLDGMDIAIDVGMGSASAGMMDAEQSLFRVADAQRLAAVALVSGTAFALALYLGYKSMYLISGYVALALLTVVAIARLGRAIGSNVVGMAALGLLGLFPFVDVLASGYTYYRASSVLKNNALSINKGLADADEMRELAEMEINATLPSTKLVLVAVALAGIGGLLFAPR